MTVCEPLSKGLDNFCMICSQNYFILVMPRIFFSNTSHCIIIFHNFNLLCYVHLQISYFSRMISLLVRYLIHHKISSIYLSYSLTSVNCIVEICYFIMYRILRNIFRFNYFENGNFYKPTNNKIVDNRNCNGMFFTPENV